jgi:hypothetical protein
MKRLSAILLLVSLVGLAASQEVRGPAKQKEPKSPAKEIPPETKDKAESEIDVHQTAERIAENAQKAGGRLKEKDPGAETRKLQNEIVKDIDALIRKAQEPPPEQKSDSSQMPPMSPPSPSDAKQPMGGGAGQSKQPMGGMGAKSGGSSQAKTGGSGAGSESRQGRRQRRDRRPGNSSPKGMGDPMGGANLGSNEPIPAKMEPKGSATGEREGTPQEDADRFGKPSPRRQSDKLADLYKDVWGHLPDRLRQEMDLYYREKFMPRYSELLRQYYAALAEQKKSGSEDR